MDYNIWLSISDFSSLIELSVGLIIAYSGFPAIANGLQKRIARQIIEICNELNKEGEIQRILDRNFLGKKHKNTKRLLEKYISFGKSCHNFLNKNTNQHGTNEHISIIKRYASIQLEKSKPIMAYIAVYGFFCLLLSGFTDSEATSIIFKEVVSISYLSYKFYILYTFFVLLGLIVLIMNTRARKILYEKEHTTLFANSFFISIVFLIVSGIIIFFAHNYNIKSIRYALYFLRDISILTTIFIIILPYPYLYILAFISVFYEIYAIKYKVKLTINSPFPNYSDFSINRTVTTIKKYFKEKEKEEKGIYLNQSINEIKRIYYFIINKIINLKIGQFIFSVHKIHKKQLYIFFIFISSCMVLIFQMIQSRINLNNEIAHFLKKANNLQYATFINVHSNKFNNHYSELKKKYSGKALQDIINVCNRRQCDTTCLCIDTVCSRYSFSEGSVEFSRIFTDSIEVVTKETWILLWRSKEDYRKVISYQSIESNQTYMIYFKNKDFKVLNNYYEGRTIRTF